MKGKLDVAVVGVAGGEEGPACWAKLKTGVLGRVAMVFDRRSIMLASCFEVKASTPAVSISNKEKEDEENCSS